VGVTCLDIKNLLRAIDKTTEIIDWIIRMTKDSKRLIAG
jgi:hypothetical protein